jgi:hypothetical protein
MLNLLMLQTEPRMTTTAAPLARKFPKVSNAAAVAVTKIR